MKKMCDVMCRIWIISACGLFIASCASVPSVFEDSTNQAESETSEESGAEDQDATTVVPARAPVIAREVEEQGTELEAVQYLLNQAEIALENNDLEKASSLSYRALQIDRKAPRAYLILARFYFMENKSEQSRVFAQQGLLYTSRKTSIGQQLEKFAQ